MASKQDVLKLLRLFSERKKNPVLPFSELVSYVQRYAEQKKKDNPEIADFLENTDLKLVTFIEELAQENRCELSYAEGKIASVSFPEFFFYIVQKRFEDIESDPELPFPSESSLDVSIPPESMTTVEIRKDFVELLGKAGEKQPKLYRLSFPDDINSFVVTSNLLGEALLQLTIERIRHYLNTQRNSFYMLGKLRGVFRSKEQIVKDMLNSVISQKDRAYQSISNPSEFSFSFWTHLANVIIKEYKEKSNKLEKEHNFCQAAYLLGYYSVYFKGIQQREKATSAAFKAIDRKLKQPPFYFTVSDITNFTDNQGIPLTKRCPQEKIHDYLQQKVKSSGDSLPTILRLKTEDKKEYYIDKEVFLPLTAKKLQEASKEYRHYFIDKWAKFIETNQKKKEMKSDAAFLYQLEERLKEEDPLLQALLSFDLFFLALQETKPQYEINIEINRLLDTHNKKLIPVDEILQLARKELLNQAKMTLPFYKTVPFLNRLFRFLGKFLSGASAGPKRQTVSSARPAAAEAPAATGVKLLGDQSNPAVAAGAASGKKSVTAAESSSQSSRARVAALQNAMVRLKVQFVGNSNLDETLEELIEKWNPLYDPDAKSNLVEDVNSLVRDFLRKLKRGFLVKPPDAPRIKNMASSLASNHAFDQIKRRDDLMRYIELYMLKVLGGR